MAIKGEFIRPLLGLNREHRLATRPEFIRYKAPLFELIIRRADGSTVTRWVDLSYPRPAAPPLRIDDIEE